MGTKRRNEMWISNNRVLVGGNKKIAGRNPNFDTEETKVLISLWGDPKVQKTLITTHKKHAVIAKLAEKMREYGYYRSPEEINTRIKNLKCFYNRIKKDMEYGAPQVPTWKHYTAMDEIMTRPIFSVRPNEIPKPSLRYRLEEEMKEREEKEKEKEKEKEREKEKEKLKTKNNSQELKKSKKIKDDEDDDDDDDEDDDEDDDDDDDDDLDDDVSFTQEMFDDEVTSQEEEKNKIKSEEISRNNNVEETPLIIPKEEPIDIDDEPEEHINSSSGNPVATLNDKITSTTTGTSLSSSSIVTGTTNSIKISQHLPLVATPNNITTVFATNQQTPISSQAGKISLVPTNLLLKPQNQQPIQIRPQPQHRIIYTKPTVHHQVTPTASIMTSGATAATATTGTAQQVPMKVLLVNTLQKPTSAASNIATKVTPTATIDPQIKNVNNITTAAVLQQHQTQQHNNITRTVTNNSVSNNSNTSIPTKKPKLSSSSASSSLKSSKEGSSFRSMLSQLVRLHSQNLDVNKQRLDIEKQRLEFEKSIAEKFLNAFISSQQQQQTNNQLNSPTLAQSSQSVLATSSLQSQTQPQISQAVPVINDSIPLLTPKIEKEDDGYEK